MGFMAAAIPIVTGIMGMMGSKDDKDDKGPSTPAPPSLGQILAENNRPDQSRNFSGSSVSPFTGMPGPTGGGIRGFNG
jgi:hypothetical protein